MGKLSSIILGGFKVLVSTRPPSVPGKCPPKKVSNPQSPKRIPQSR